MLLRLPPAGILRPNALARSRQLSFAYAFQNGISPPFVTRGRVANTSYHVTATTPELYAAPGGIGFTGDGWGGSDAGNSYALSQSSGTVLMYLSQFVDGGNGIRRWFTQFGTGDHQHRMEVIGGNFSFGWLSGGVPRFVEASAVGYYTAGRPFTIASTWDASGQAGYASGRQFGTNSAGYGNTAGSIISIGYLPGFGFEAGRIKPSALHYVLVFDRALSANEIAEAERDPWWWVDRPARISRPTRLAGAGLDDTAAGAIVSASTAIVVGAATVQIDASGAGVTVAATTSSIAGAVQLAQAAAGATVQAAAAQIPGATTLAQTAAGATVAATTATIPGATTLAQSAGGSTVQAAASPIPGDATVGAAADGTTRTASTSPIAGPADVIAGNADATASGATLAAVTSPVAGVAGVSASATGALVVGATALVAGAVVLSQVAGGALVTAWATGLPGSVTVAHSVAGALVSAATVAVPGAAGVAAQAGGALLAATTSPLPGGTTLAQSAAGAVVAAIGIAIAGLATTPSRPVPPARIVALPARDRAAFLDPRARIIALPYRPAIRILPPERNE